MSTFSIKRVEQQNRYSNADMWFLTYGRDYVRRIRTTLVEWVKLCDALQTPNITHIDLTYVRYVKDYYGDDWVYNQTSAPHMKQVRVRMRPHQVDEFIQAVREIVGAEEIRELADAPGKPVVLPNGFHVTDAELTRHVEILRDALSEAWKELHSYTRLSTLGRVATGSAIQNTQRVMAKIQEAFQVSLFPAHPVRMELRYDRTRALGCYRDDPDFKRVVDDLRNVLDNVPVGESKRERWREIFGELYDAAQLAWQMSEDKSSYDLGGEGG